MRDIRGITRGARRIALLVAALVLCGSLVARAAEALPDPVKPGPFPVGVTTMVIVDHSRLDEATHGPRTMLLEIWYPATDESRDLPPNRLSDYLLRGAHPGLNMAVRMAFKADPTALDATFTSHAVRDARMRDGKFPLIVFSHGNGGVRHQSSFWCDHMASHGYIVAAPDHTGNSTVTVVEGRLVLYNPNGQEASAGHRPQDISFVIDRMEAMNRGEDSRFAGRVDLDRVGVAGHSFGGYTAAAVINTDPRVKAIIAMTPVMPERTNYTTPVMVMVATEDATIGVLGNEKARRYFEESRGPHYLLEITDAGHYSFTDMFQVNPKHGDGVGEGIMVTQPGVPIRYRAMQPTYDIINAASGRFFGLYLKGEDGYAESLRENSYGDGVLVKAVVPEPVTVAAPAPPASAAANDGVPVSRAAGAEGAPAL